MGLKKTILIIVTLLLLFTIYYSTPAHPEDSSTTPANTVAQITVEPDRVLVLDEGYIQTVKRGDRQKIASLIFSTLPLYHHQPPNFQFFV